ncbi:MAG: hypothetical protein ACU0AY_18370 [Marinibacterium profundimaris]
MSPALADCSVFNGSILNCTGDVTGIQVTPSNDGITTVQVSNLTSDMTDSGDGNNYFLNLTARNQSDLHLVEADFDLFGGGYSMDVQTGAIFGEIEMARGADQDGENATEARGLGRDVYAADGGAGSSSNGLGVKVTGPDGTMLSASPTDQSAGINLTSTGGDGGNAQEAYTKDAGDAAHGGNGGRGGDGGDVYLTVADQVALRFSTVGAGNGIYMSSTGGNASAGGIGSTRFADSAYGGVGGAGGNGGDVSLYAPGSDNQISTENGYGIALLSQAGDGGTGGLADGDIDYPGAGGNGGTGGSVELTGFGGSVSTQGDDASAIWLQSAGGVSGAQGNSKGFDGSYHPADPSLPGYAGSVTGTLNNASLSTSGDTAHGLLAQSVGGQGGSGGDSSGVTSYGASAGSGGDGEDVTLTITNTTFETGGQFSGGIVAVSAGGGGGTGGHASGLTAMGGTGGSGGNGSDVTVSLDATTIRTGGQFADGLHVMSVGGTGGFSGGASGIKSMGASGGAGGNGGTASLTTTNSEIETNDLASAGIVVLSGGGGGGSSHSVSGLETLGASGGSGGDGGDVSYTSTADPDSGNGTSVATQGDMSEGIALISHGRGGGKASSSFKLSIFGGNQQIGATGSGGGNGGNITFSMSDADSISTAGHASEGLLAHSVGGGGGKSGNVTQIDVINSGSASTQSLGAAGGDAGEAGDITGTVAGTIMTTGAASAGVLAVSLGGGGGVAGNQTDVTVGVTLNSNTGAGGGAGGNAGTVDIKSSAAISTSGDLSEGVMAASIGGSGGHSSNVQNIGVGLNVSDVGINSRVGASGGSAGWGHDVTVALDENSSIKTTGDVSAGAVGLSVGGSGGNGGTVVNAGANIVNLGIANGSSGGSASGAYSVTASNDGTIDTSGHVSPGLLALAVGGSGGKSGTVVNGSASVLDLTMTFGGSGGGGGTTQEVTVTNTGAIRTAGDLSFGILASSIAGAGGAGGVTVSGNIGVSSAQNTLGSSGGAGGTASTVTVSSSADVTTTGNKSSAIAALSIGGSGGAAGTTFSGAGDFGPMSGSVTLAVGGDGGKGGTSDTVSVTTTDGTITTTGFRSHGIAGKSHGGHGGIGGGIFAGSIDGSSVGSGSVSVTVGGSGGDGGVAGDVEIDNAANVKTSGHYSFGLAAVSSGGSGGDGGSSYSGNLTVTTGTSLETNVTVGGDGGNGGTAGDISLRNTGDISTTGGNAHAIFANSVGGNGGSGGSGVSYLANFGTTKNTKVSFSGNVYVGGSGGSGSTGGKVTVENSATITTEQDTSAGIHAHSVGGNGGEGGNAGAFTVGYTSETEGTEPMELNYSFSIGGDGGGGSTGGDVSVSNDKGGAISTQGTTSYGIFAQSVGGNGGSGGNGEPDAKGWVADIYDAYEDVNSIKEQYEQIKKAKENIANLLTNFSMSIGGSSGAAADGGDVTVSNAGAISTSGHSATAIYAQSVGGGGGAGGDGSQGLLTSIALAGSSGGGGDSGEISITNDGTLNTTGAGAMGIYAQAVGGGGGTGGDIESSIVHGFTDMLQTIGSQTMGDSNGGDGGNGGDVTISLGAGSSIRTTGANAHGVWAQSVGGGGGAAGEFDVEESGNSPGKVGSTGNMGNGGFVDLDIDGDITVTGDGAHGVFAQSVSGGTYDSTAGGVRLNVSGTISAQGANARAILVQADAQSLEIVNSGSCVGSKANTKMCNGTSHVTVEKGATVEVTGQDPYGAVGFMSGLENLNSDGSIFVSNLLENFGTVSALSGDSFGTAIASDGTGALRIQNRSGGKITGSVVLTGDPGSNSDSGQPTEFVNYSGARFEPGDTVSLGRAGTYTGESGSTISPFGDSQVGSSAFTVGMAHKEQGTYVVNLTEVSGLIKSDHISLQDAGGADGVLAPMVMFSPVVKPTWLTAPTQWWLMDKATIIAEIDYSVGVFDDEGATVSDSPTATYSLGTADSGHALVLSYSIDYSGDTTGAVLSGNAREYGSYFTDVAMMAEEGGTDAALRHDIAALGADYLNAESDLDLETAYRYHILDESLIGATGAAQSAHAIRNLLQSCPTIDPAAGLDFLHQTQCTWVQAIGSKRHQDATDESPAYDENSWGMAVGTQHEVGPDLFLEFGGQIETVSVGGANFSQDGERYSFGAALKKEIGRYTLSTTLVGGLYNLDYDRRYSVNNRGYEANSDIDGRYLGAELRASAVYLGQGGFYAKPSAALAYTKVWQDGFTESGTGSQNWQVGSQDYGWLTFNPMIELGRAFNVQNRASLAYVRAGATMTLTDPSLTMTSGLVGADASVANLSSTLTTDRYQGDLALGVEIMLRDNLAVSLEGSGAMSENSYDYGGTARIEFRF